MKIYVWGIGPARSELIQTAETSPEAMEAMHVNCQDDFDMSHSDAWAVGLETTEEAFMASIAHDPAVSGYFFAGGETPEPLTIRIYYDEIRVNGESISMDDLAVAALPDEYLEAGEILPRKIEGQDGDSDVILVVDEGNAEAGHQIRIVHEPTPEDPANWFFQYIGVAWRK